MLLLDRTFPTPEADLACDAALLHGCEAQGEPEILRFWESQTPVVVLGYSDVASREVNLEACEARGVPILRRGSGGGTVLQGPGCLCYSLLLRIEAHGPTAGVLTTNAFIMEKQRRALANLLRAPVEVQGFTDLSLHGRKFSGNAQQRKQKFLLFHGTFLLDFDLSLIEELLAMPSKQPAYRDGRSHADFLTNLPVSAAHIKTALCHEWQVEADKSNSLMASLRRALKAPLMR